jgi:hypothetical protein
MLWKKNRRPRDTPRGTSKCWSLWRHCCCRLGVYPLAVAPLMTAACLLSLYSSTGCEFLELSVGFTPINAAMNQSQVNFGLFYYQPIVAAAVQEQEAEDDLSNDENKFQQVLFDGCKAYTTAITDDYVDKDRTWKVARIMAMIAAATAGIGSILAWSFVITPLSPNCAWPGILLPLVMIAFIAEGSKFLIFDIALCRNSLWLPSGVDSLPQSAESCELGTSAIAGIAAGSLLLVVLLAVCLKVPEYRDLDPDYDGVVYVTGANHDVEAAAAVACFNNNSNNNSTNGSRDQDSTQFPNDTSSKSSSFPEDSTVDDGVYPTTTDPQLQESTSNCYYDDNEHDLKKAGSNKASSGHLEKQASRDSDTLKSFASSGRDSSATISTQATQAEPGDPPVKPEFRSNSTSMEGTTSTDNKNEHVSESRLSKVAQMERSASAQESNHMIEQFVSDLNTAFQSPSDDEDSK